jgi:hypothetical protein
MRLEDLIEELNELVQNEQVDSDTEVYFYDDVRGHPIPAKIQGVDKGGSLILEEEEE